METKFYSAPFRLFKSMQSKLAPRGALEIYSCATNGEAWKGISSISPCNYNDHRAARCMAWAAARKNRFTVWHSPARERGGARRGICIQSRCCLHSGNHSRRGEPQHSEIACTHMHTCTHTQQQRSASCDPSREINCTDAAAAAAAVEICWVSVRCEFNSAWGDNKEMKAQSASFSHFGTGDLFSWQKCCPGHLKDFGLLQNVRTSSPVSKN